METKPSRGLIGLGIMGRPMGCHLLRAGCVLTIHDMDEGLAAPATSNPACNGDWTSATT